MNNYFENRTFHNVEQNSDEWMDLRTGRFTASMFGDLMMKPTTATYQNAINKVIAERLTGTQQDDFFTGGYLERGHEMEPFARAEYEARYLVDLQPGGFFTLGEWLGASPDGVYMGGDMGVEIKCPARHTTIQHIRTGSEAAKYKWQILGQMLVCGFNSVHLYVWHPELADYCERTMIFPDVAEMELLKAKLTEAIELVEFEVNWIKNVGKRNK